MVCLRLDLEQPNRECLIMDNCVEGEKSGVEDLALGTECVETSNVSDCVDSICTRTRTRGVMVRRGNGYKERMPLRPYHDLLTMCIYRMICKTYVDEGQRLGQPPLSWMVMEKK